MFSGGIEWNIGGKWANSSNYLFDILGNVEKLKALQK